MKRKKEKRWHKGMPTSIKVHSRHTSVLVLAREQGQQDERDERMRQRMRLPRFDTAPQRIFTSGKRRAVIGEIASILRDWTCSPFEHEAMCRTGLRIEFCLKGRPWAAADSEAESIVALALDETGAERPSWDEGQHGHSAGPDYCRRCYRALDDEQIAHGHQFCSAECAKAAIDDRFAEGTATNNEILRKARRIVRRSRRAAATCLTCGKSYVPFNDAESRPQKYCSRECYAVFQSMPKFDRACEFCGERFVAKKKTALFCSSACSQKGSMVRRGAWENRIRPRVVTTLIFDFIVARPPMQLRPSAVTAAA